MKVDLELEAAIKKHGVVVPQQKHEDKFFERIKKKKEEIYSTAWDTFLLVSIIYIYILFALK